MRPVPISDGVIAWLIGINPIATRTPDARMAFCARFALGCRHIPTALASTLIIFAIVTGGLVLMRLA